MTIGWIHRSTEERRIEIANKEVKIAIIGFGYIGGSIGIKLASEGFDVIGVDVNESLVKRINDGDTPFEEPGLEDLHGIAKSNGKIHATTDFSEISDCHIILMVVGTPLDENFNSDLTHLKSAVSSMAPHISEGSLIMVKSTVPPGTTTEVIGPIIESCFEAT